TELSFEQQPIQNAANAKWNWVGAISPDGEGSPIIALANERELVIGNQRYPFPSGPNSTPPSPRGVTALDFNYDFKTDLVLAGAGGMRLLKQDTGAKFVDVTADTKLPANVLSQSYRGSWPADIDSDGDLDIVLSNEAGAPSVLRNNGDGSFTE